MVNDSQNPLACARAALTFTRVGIVGAGTMGRGIALIAAQAGCTVLLTDAQVGALEAARAALRQTWDKLVAEGRMTVDDANACWTRLVPVDKIDALAGCDLVIEAIVERLDAKQALFVQLENIVSADTVLTSNTSSLSVTAIGSALQRPQRLAGFHFFNPVPLMKVVEIVCGLKTDTAVAERLATFARALGHTPVLAQDTPGFIVNHAGRGYNTEALRIAGERVADFATIDRILKDQLGFRLGPFELLDLTALDVSQPVMESIYHQYYEEPRFRPSVIAAQRLAAGVVGRKVGEGFYRYVDGQAQLPPEPAVPALSVLPPVWVSAHAQRRTELLQPLQNLGADIETAAAPSERALIVVAPLGHDVTTAAAREQLDPARTVGIDMLLPDAAINRRVLATNPATRSDMRAAAHALLARDGKAVSVIRDSGSFVSQRVIATIVNIAADMCQQGICTPSDLDMAVTLGLGYPAGPLAWGDRIGVARILEILSNLQTVYGDMRYRPSPWLRRRGVLGLSLLHTEG